MGGSVEIRSPKVPGDLAASALTALSDHDEIRRATVTGANVADASAKGVRFDTVRLARSSLARMMLSRPDWTDVVATACDLSGSALDSPTLTRVLFEGCTLVGARWSDARLTDVRFVDCQIELAAFWAARFTRARFERCKLREADFHGADLGGVVFEQCDLARSNWADTRLQAADVSTSDIGGIKVAANAVVGLVVNRTQAVDLATAFGLVVR